MKQILICTLLLTIGTLSLGSCSSALGKKTAKSGGDEYAIVNVDGNDVLLKVKRDSRGEIVVDDSSLNEMTEVAENSAQNSIDESQRMKDGSQIVTMNDGYGNKVETRTFDGDRRLKQVVVRSFTNGNVRVFVYGINGEVRSVPDGFQGQVLVASAGQIADAAKIYERFQESDLRTYNDVRRTDVSEYPSTRTIREDSDRSGDRVVDRTTQTTSTEPDRTTVQPSSPQTTNRSDRNESPNSPPQNPEK